MNALTHRSLWSFLFAVLLGLAVLDPAAGVAAQDEPAPGATPGEPAPPPAAAPDRGPSYEREAPAGALRLPGEPPAVGDLIVEDSLAFPGAIPGSVSCVTGRNIAEFVGEGYIFKVTGKCRPESPSAALATPPIPGLEVPDGEIRIEVKVVSGHERANPVVLFRGQRDPFGGYELSVNPARGGAVLFKDGPGTTSTPIAGRADLAGRLSREDWNDLAIRLNGPEIWVLVNGEPILSVSEPAYERGFVALGLARVGNPDDSAESAVVYRNLRISRLAAPR